MMNLNHLDSDSDRQSDYADNPGDDVDDHLNHYRVEYGYGFNNPPRTRAFREQMKCCHEGGKIMTLAELAAQKVACHLPFGLVEHYRPPVPEPMQCRIAFWSFPQDEEDVKLYTCLANGNADFFYRAEVLIQQDAVRDILQVGFHLSANVELMGENEHLETFRVAVTFDRRRITSCSCTCTTATFWCQHVVAVCLHRIRNPQEVKIRAPVSESLQRLEKNQLQKFAQYLINELPQQILPAAQKLLDELLAGDDSSINLQPGAPDPTAGATINEATSWCLDYTHLSMDIHRILNKQCGVQPIVCSDIRTLDETPPPATAEYQQLLRPIRGREPEGIWNLISIVGEMMKRRDPNLFLLLEIMTDEVMKVDKIVTWWFETKVSMHSGSSIHVAHAKNSQSASQYSSSNFCDEIVHLWRLAALNPSATQAERQELSAKFFAWHLAILQRHSSLSESNGRVVALAEVAGGPNGQATSKRNLLELFPGFKSAMEGCQVDWADWDEKSARLTSVSDPLQASSESGNQQQQQEKASKPSKRRKRRSKAKQRALRELTELEQQTQATTTAQAEHDTPPEHGGENNSEDDGEEGEAENEENSTKNPPTAQGHPENDIEANKENLEANAVNGAQQDHQEAAEPARENVGERSRAPTPRLREQNPQALDDDLQVYFMDRQQEEGALKTGDGTENLEDLIKVNVRRLADPIETLFAKTEGLHAHGHLDEARKLARQLANEILSQRNYPSARQLFILPRRRKKKGTLDNQMTIVASETLAKIHFLCHVLMDDVDNHGLIFRLVMFGVELKRAPAATRLLEVKLISQKQELIGLLRSISLRDQEFDIIRSKARTIRDYSEESEADEEPGAPPGSRMGPLTTLIMGDYLFEALVLSQEHQARREPGDAELGFQCALSAIGVKMNVLETDHPLLCEGIRRQLGGLALSLLNHHKDDQEKLDAILKRLLDEDHTTRAVKPAAIATTTSISEKPTSSMATSNSSASCANSSNCGYSTSSSSVGNKRLGGSTPQPTNTTQNQHQHQQQQQQQHELNQPTEAAVHFMFELAKTVYDKAGGSSNTAHLFRPQVVVRPTHRKLHMCTLRIALHALGLQNRLQANWLQRTFSGRAEFVRSHAHELGLPGIKFLCKHWEGYLTPAEAAEAAKKAGGTNDPDTKRVAAEMAKSCLKYANCLNYDWVGNILAQCRGQSVEMFEEACSEIEQLAEEDSVCAEVLFATARAWHNLYKDLSKDESKQCASENLYQLTSTDHQDTGADEWLAASGQSSHLSMGGLAFGLGHHGQMVSAHMGDFCPPMWDVYARSECMLTRETPTYKNFDYVRAAFRLGIKALDSFKLSLNAGSKHNPFMREQILWLVQISKSLGRDCFYIFSCAVVRNILDPYILHLIISEIIEFFDIIKLPENHIDRVNILEPIYDKCLDRCLRQTKDLLKHIPYESGIENILDVMKNLTSATKSLVTAQHYWEIVRFLELKLSKRSLNRRIKLCNSLADRRQWLKQFALDLKCCECNDCWKKRSLPHESRFRFLYQPNN